MTESKTRSGEFALIKRLTRLLSAETPEAVAVGPGDDCAVVRRGSELDVYTTDTMVDGVHFRSDEIPWFDLGWKSIAVNLSDIAGMGAQPLHSLVTLGVPDYVSDDDLDAIYRGMNAIVEQFGGAIVGGDIVRSNELFITVAAVGTRSDDEQGDLPLLLRSKAKVGDVVAVTGELGLAAAGLAAVERDMSDQLPDLVSHHYRPTPRVAEGLALISAGVRCGMDISDGLVADLGHLCESSEVNATLLSARIPLSDELESAFPEEALSFALSGGEDYELVFAAPATMIEKAQTDCATQITVIGEIVERGAGTDERVGVFDEYGLRVELAATGWDHLRT